MTKGRNKTNEEAITIPYRNGILHGRELAFDNRIAAAKCWAALFAARDWAVAISDGKKSQKPKVKIIWTELVSQITENNRKNKLLEKWSPRKENELGHLPHFGSSSELPNGTPECAVSEFIENWCNRRYGLLAEAILSFTDTTKGKKAGMAKEDFGRNVPSSFEIISVEDQAAAVSHVMVNLVFIDHGKTVNKQLSVRAIYQDNENNSVVWSEGNGRWKIVQNSFSEVLYAIRL